MYTYQIRAKEHDVGGIRCGTEAKEEGLALDRGTKVKISSFFFFTAVDVTNYVVQLRTRPFTCFLGHRKFLGIVSFHDSRTTCFFSPWRFSTWFGPRNYKAVSQPVVQ